MKIVLTTDTYWPRINGVTVVVDGLRRFLAAAGHEVHVFAPAYPKQATDAGRPDPPGVHRFSGFSFPLSREDRVGWPANRWRITRLLEDLRPDIVHSHTEFMIGFSGKSYCRRHGVPHLMTCHAMYEEYFQTYLPGTPRWLARAVVSSWSRSDYRLASRVVVPGGHLKQRIIGYGVTTPIDVIPNGIDPVELSLTPAQRGFQAERLAPILQRLAGRRILIYVGRISREKNIDFLLRSFTQVRQASPEAVLLLVGDGPYRKELQRSVREEGCAEKVQFTGYLDRRAVAYLLSAADVFVFASKTEVHPLVLIEAMTCGTPIVAVNARGTDELLDGTREGERVPEDEEVFARRVSDLLADRAFRARRSAEVREAAKSWTLQRMAGRTLALYQELLQG